MYSLEPSQKGDLRSPLESGISHLAFLINVFNRGQGTGR
jgi:hypothetical protein